MKDFYKSSQALFCLPDIYRTKKSNKFIIIYRQHQPRKKLTDILKPDIPENKTIGIDELGEIRTDEIRNELVNQFENARKKND
jgi:hypothetical protein